MEYKSVSHRQLARVGHNLIGVIHNWVQRDAPLLMPDNSFAMLARRPRIVAVAVVLESRDAVRH